MSVLDDAVCRTAHSVTGPGDAVTAWLTIAGVRSVDGGGYVITVCSEDAPPDWQVRGLLWEALVALDQHCDCGDHGC